MPASSTRCAAQDCVRWRAAVQAAERQAGNLDVVAALVAICIGMVGGDLPPRHHWCGRHSLVAAPTVCSDTYFISTWSLAQTRSPARHRPRGTAWVATSRNNHSDDTTYVVYHEMQASLRDPRQMQDNPRGIACDS